MFIEFFCGVSGGGCAAGVLVLLVVGAAFLVFATGVVGGVGAAFGFA